MRLSQTFPVNRFSTARHAQSHALKINKLISLLVIGILISAFGVVYTKDLNRRLFIQFQNVLQVRQQYEIEWGKLLLEQSTWSTQARIQTIAQHKLGMVFPKQKDIVIVDE